jgi:hypothetical protein
MTDPVVRTAHGDVRCMLSTGVQRFLGTRGEFFWPEYTAKAQSCLALETGEVMRDAAIPAATWV